MFTLISALFIKNRKNSTSGHLVGGAIVVIIDKEMPLLYNGY